MSHMSLYRMRKDALVDYAWELEQTLKKAEAEAERIRAEREDKIRSEIRDEERKEWVETGLIMARDTVDEVLEDMNDRDELSLDLYFELKYRMRCAFDSLDIDSIV